MSIFNNNLLAGAAAQGGTTPVHTIDQSIRFNDNDSAYMYRAFSGAGDLQKATMSCWLKMGNISTNKGIFTFISDKPLELDSNNNLKVHAFGSNRLITDREFRDPSAWYHIVLSIDSTQAVSTERIRLYVNGQRETSFSTESYPSQNTNGSWWSSNFLQIGRTYGTSNYMDGYLAEIVYIDGTRLDPSSFGEYNSSGIWIPKDVSGLTFGTNGIYLKGDDSSALGTDSSGNGSNFTTSGLAAHDQVADSPTNNFAVTNAVNSHPNVALSEGNLKQVNSGTSIAYGSSSTILLTSGKWYVEWRLNTLVSNEYPVVGLYSTNEGRSSLSTASSFPGLLGTFADIGFGANDGNRFEDNTTTSSWGNAYANGNIAALAIDMDNKKIWFGHNNSGSFVWQASGDPAAGSNEANTKAFASDVVVGVGHYSSSSVTFNFGQDGTFGGTETAQGNADGNGVGNFYYAPPTGFLAICTKNLGS